MIRRLAAALALAAVACLGNTACTPVTVVAGAAAGLGSAAVEERGIEGAIDDTKIRAVISHLWFQQNVEMFQKVTLTIKEGRVLLTGQVADPEARVNAVRLSWQAPGVREVINEIQVSDDSSVIDYSRDVVIANTLRSKLLFDSDIRNVNYSVDVVNGMVYLMGIAQNESERERVIAHARNIAHVKRVVNYVLLKDERKRFGS
ncbi:MAG: BON domain-containing protein [Rhodospirillales bacterium]|nr:BON domain-containing protein [Rhodospirillales bacterium]